MPAYRRWRLLLTLFPCLIAAIVVISSSLIVWSRHQSATAAPIAIKDANTSTPAKLIHPKPENIAFAQQQHAIDPVFQSYVSKNGGATTFGAAITGLIPTTRAQVQIFQNSIVAQTAGKNTTITTSPVVSQMISDHAAVTLGGTSLTYASLDSLMTPIDPPWWYSSQGIPEVNGIFIQTNPAKGTTGHYIPATFVPFLKKVPNWRSLFGTPIAEAASATNQSGQVVTVLAFARTILIATLDTSSKLTVSYQPVGSDYIAIYGAPSLAAQKGKTIWTLNQKVDVYDAVNGKVFTSLQGYQTTILGTQWVKNDLWVNVSWQEGVATRSGWIQSNALSFTQPAKATEVADLNALVPGLQDYVDSQTGITDVAVYVPATNRYYEANPDQTSCMGSTSKVPILLTLLNMVEQQQRDLTDNERYLATQMITVSDNDAAQSLYLEVGYYDAVNAYLSSIGITGITMGPLFGYSQVTAVGMVQLLDELRAGRILTADHRAFALNLMSNIVPDQQLGVGTTAPAGAHVAMKDGWVVTEDGTWLTGTVGIVTHPKITYIIAVYVQEHDDFDASFAIVDKICSDIGKTLTGM